MAKGTICKVILLGRLGQDPDVRATAGGTQVVNLNVATTEMGPKDQNGQRQDLTEWHRAVLFGRTAEIAAQYLRKGSLVYIEGRLQTRSWEDQQGNKKYTTEIVAYEMQLMGGNKPDDQQGNQPQQPQQQGHRQPPQGYVPQQGHNPNQQPQNEYGDVAPFDDVPFSRSNHYEG